MFFSRSSKKKEPRHDEITAFLGAGTRYEGQFNFQGVVRIDGGVNGDITSTGSLVLGEEALVEGSIRVGRLISNGRIVGDVIASESVALNKNSRLRGNICAPVVVIEEGAVFNGRLATGPDVLARLPEGASPDSDNADEAAPIESA